MTTLSFCDKDDDDHHHHLPRPQRPAVVLPDEPYAHEARHKGHGARSRPDVVLGRDLALGEGEQSLPLSLRDNEVG